MQAWILALLLSAVIAFLSDRLKNTLRAALARRPARVFAAPCLLTAVFAVAAQSAGAATAPLLLAVFAYTLAPTLAAYSLGPGPAKVPLAADFLAIALLWLPLELAVGASLVPRPAQAFLHSVAYGIAIILALVLFAGFRAFKGMKYNPPRGARDVLIPLLTLAAAAPVLALAGLATGFIPAPHAPAHAAPAWLATRIAVIFAATALPEEILFRSLIQNLLTLRFGSTNAMVLAAAAIFGCSHLNNGPQPLPNWRYAIVATIAGFAFGKVFQMAGTVLSSAACHTAVNAIKYFFF